MPRRFFLLLMLAGSLFIAAGSLAYFDFETLPPFVVEKLPLRFETLYLFALRVHVASAAVAFPLCLALVTRTLQRRPRLHRWLGRVAGVVILGALVPSGAGLALAAKGGSAGTLGFLLSGAIVATAVVLGVRAARRGDLIAHRRAMLHVVSQMSVAVSSRALIVAFDRAGLDPDVAYVVALWGPVLASVAGAELVAVRFGLAPVRRALDTARAFFADPSLKGIHREISPLPAPVRARAGRPVARVGR
ncbi:MAG TPA: DUF2306 domain-containing protein [Polyangiaceae bacterium]|nr:DUF2306 domain-containing protein [Polyangiaceae bacterium]